MHSQGCLTLRQACSRYRQRCCMLRKQTAGPGRAPAAQIRGATSTFTGEAAAEPTSRCSATPGIRQLRACVRNQGSPAKAHPALASLCALGEAAERAEHAPAVPQVSEPAAFTQRQTKKRKRQWGDPKFATETGAPSPAAGSKGVRRSAECLSAFHTACKVSVIAGTLLCLPRTAPRQLWCPRDMERSTGVLSRKSCLILSTAK